MTRNRIAQLTPLIVTTLVLLEGSGSISYPCVAETPYVIRYADPLNQPWRISRFRELEGQGLSCVTEDLSGNMWFGLGNGVVQYDGYQWQHFSKAKGLPEFPVRALTTLKDGSLIAATDGGLYQFDGQRWSSLSSLGNCPLPNVSFVIEAADSSLWVGSDFGLLRLQNGLTTMITSESYAPYLRQSKRFNTIATFPSECLSTRSVSQGTGVRLVGNEVVFLANESPAREAGMRLGDRIMSVNGNANQHVRTLQREPGSMIRIELQRPNTEALEVFSFETREIASSIYFPSIHSFLEDSHGRIWVGTNGNRLLLSDDTGKTWRRVEGGAELQLGTRPAAFELSNGDILVVSAGRNTAACRFDGNVWTSTPLAFLTGADFRSSIRETVDGTIWVSGLDRLYVFNRGKWAVHDTRDLDLPGEGQRMFIASDDALWIIGQGQYAARIALSLNECLTLDGLNYQCTDTQGAHWFIDTNTQQIVRRGKDKTVAFETTDNVIAHPNGIKATPSGVVAVGRMGQVASLCVYDGDKWQRQRFPEVATEFSSTSIHVEDNGQIWVAAAGRRIRNQVGGVVAGNGSTWVHHRPPGPPRSATSTTGGEDGRIMFAGVNGLSTLDGTNWNQSDDEVFKSNRCPGMALDSAGTIWIASAKRGVLRNQGERWESLATEHGLAGFDVNKIIAGQRDDVWASTSRGLFRFDGTRFHRLNLPNSVGRRSLNLGKKGSIWMDGRHCFYPSQAPPQVTVRTNQISIEHGGRSVIALDGTDRWNRTRADNLSYSTKLDDQAWTSFQKQPLLVLEDLSTGAHTLRIRARDEDFNVSTEDSVVSISVAPPFWRTPFFLTICSVALAFIISQSYRLARRSRELRQSNAQLKIAQSRLEDKVAETSARFRTVCDCSPVGIFVADTNARLTYANRRLQEIMGVKAESEVLADRWVQALHPEDRENILGGWRHAVSEQSRFHSHGRMVPPKGHTVYFELVADCINHQGDLLGYVCVLEDVTEKRRAEQNLRTSNTKLVETLVQLEQAQDLAIKQERLGALGQMAAGVAHDINNSLSPLLTYAELLGEEMPENERARRWTELIRLGVSDMAETVRRLDHFNRKAHGQDELLSIDLVDLVKQTVELTRPKWENVPTKDGKSVNVNVGATSNPTVSAVASQIRSVLTNLIFNSVDAIEDSGTVNIRVSSTDKWARLEVQDNGAGMTQEQLDRCLEPFYTSKAKGSGLGLSECHGIIRQHGGSMTVESTQGRGTTVRLELPLSPTGTLSKKKQEVPPQQPKVQAGPETNVLYVDDDEMVQKSVCELLKRIGLQVTLASDGMEALEMMNQHSFRLVMSDYGLPGMTGGELLKEIKSKWPDTPVIIVSGWSNPVSKKGIQPDAYLKKPFSLSELSTLLQPYLPGNDAA